MSLIFNYSKIKDTVSRAGLPGQRAKVTPTDTATAFVTGTTGTFENGMAVKVVTDSHGVARVQPIVAGDTAETVAGFILQDITGEYVLSNPIGSPRFIYQYANGKEVSVLSKGVIWVPVQDDGNIVKGQTVYVRNAVDSTNGHPVGGIETKSGTGLVAIKAKFTGQVGYPLASNKNGTTTAGLTGRTAAIVVELPTLA